MFASFAMNYPITKPFFNMFLVPHPKSAEISDRFLSHLPAAVWFLPSCGAEKLFGVVFFLTKDSLYQDSVSS